jgi:type 2 lantibiotic biosynthesis protein LanM
MTTEEPDWYLGLHGAERIADLRRTAASLEDGEIDVEAAEWRRNKLLAQSPFSVPAFFARRLAMDGLDEAELFALLGEGAAAVQARAPGAPGWLLGIEEAFRDFAGGELPLLPAGLLKDSSVGFLNAAGPLIRWGYERVRRRRIELARRDPEAPLGDATVDLLGASLLERLLAMLSRTLVTELHVARLRDQLSGDTSEARFQSFIERLRDPACALGLLREYPVLARLLAMTVELWVETSVELLSRLCADWSAIRELLSPDMNPGPLTEIEGGAGDLHRGGRAVAILRFESGFQVVYKPRPLAIDVHFQELLAWLHDRGAPRLLTPRALARDGYGWVEHMAVRPCASAEEVERFYVRQGAWLALLYALEATDFHSENLIAAGEYPIPIDLESLFHPRFTRPDSQPVDSVAGQAMLDSVLRIGLLPQRYWGGKDFAGLEFSGLGGKEGQLTAADVPYWAHNGTDEMALARGRGRFPGAKNRPRLGDAPVDVLDHTGAIVRGFTEMYELLLGHRAELLAVGGPLQRFAGDEVRVILRHTSFYSLLLRESLHPYVLRNALDRDRLFDRLWFGLDRSGEVERVVQVIPSERRDLWRGDIPAFSTRIDARHIWDSQGHVFPDFLADSGLTAVVQRFSRLGPDDLAQQIRLIHGSLTALAMDAEPVWVSFPPREPRRRADRERLLAAASAVGDRLDTLALRSGDLCSWIGVTLNRARHWALVPLGVDLYSGLPGVVLFLAGLARQTGEPRYRRLAEAAWKSAQLGLAKSEDTLRSVGGFEGWGGILYTLSLLSRLWERADLLAEAVRIAGRLEPWIEEDRSLDIMGGSAGCIRALLGLHRLAPADRLLDLAILCGDRLVASAEPAGEGVGWRTLISPGRCLTGFSHGAAGFSWALLELFAATREERFRATALQALAYERGFFDAEESNWPDLREPESPSPEPERPRFMAAWCHGAPGIGLARLRLLRLLDDPEIRDEAGAALRTTLRRGFGSNQSLCHGDLGNLEVIAEASRRLPDGDRWRDELDRRSAAILEHIEENGCSCGVPHGVETPGLFVGLAGIGYGLLRLADPDLLPCPLLLDLPEA